jgi:hypothetical protein
VIALPGTYTVNIDTTFTGSNIVLGDGGSAQPTLALASRTLTINKKLVIKPGATLLLGDNGTDVVAGTGTVENYGTIRATISATMSAALTMDAAAQLIIDARPAGTLSFTVANGFTNNGQIHLIASPFIPSITFTVAAGTLVNAAGGSIDNAVVGGSSEIAAALTNLGTISATNRLILSNPQKAASGISTNSGTMTVAPNALLQISDNASFTNAGKISVPGTGNFRVLAAKFIEQSSATFNGGGSLAVQSGTVVLDGPMTVRAFALTDGTALVSAGGSISGANFTFIRAVVDGTGTVTNVGGAVSQIDASDVRVPLINRGDLTLGGSIDLRGPVTTFAGSTMRLQPVAGGARPVVHLYQGAFTNNGILQFVGGARPDGLSLLDLGAGGSLANSTFGTITTSSAAGGPAQITGNVSNAGIITVDPAGTAQLVVAGSYASASTAIVNLHVGPGTASSELAVIGTASFQGTLNVAALGGTPAANSSYVLFQYNSGSTVAFDTTNLPEGAASWRQDVLATGYVITRR